MRPVRWPPRKPTHVTSGCVLVWSDTREPVLCADRKGRLREKVPCWRWDRRGDYIGGYHGMLWLDRLTRVPR